MIIIFLFLLIALIPILICILRKLFNKFVFACLMLISIAFATFTTTVFLLDFPTLISGGVQLKTNIVAFNELGSRKFHILSINTNEDNVYWTMGKLPPTSKRNDSFEINLAIMRTGNFDIKTKDLLKSPVVISFLPNSKFLLKIEFYDNNMKFQIFDCNDFSIENTAVLALLLIEVLFLIMYATRRTQL